eukprot:761113-Hanusia_phi.AAC.5
MTQEPSASCSLPLSVPTAASLQTQPSLTRRDTPRHQAAAACFLAVLLATVAFIHLLSPDASRTSDMQQDAYDQELRAIRLSRHGGGLTSAREAQAVACGSACKASRSRGCAMCRMQHRMMLSSNLVDQYGVVTPIPDGSGLSRPDTGSEEEDVAGCVLTGDTTRDERRIDCASLAKQPACYDALSDYVLGRPEPAHVRWEWDDQVDHSSDDREGAPARQGVTVDAIVEVRTGNRIDADGERDLMTAAELFAEFVPQQRRLALALEGGGALPRFLVTWRKKWRRISCGEKEYQNGGGRALMKDQYKNTMCRIYALPMT